jgi:hypothetical protein
VRNSVLCFCKLATVLKLRASRLSSANCVASQRDERQHNGRFDGAATRESAPHFKESVKLWSL